MIVGQRIASIMDADQIIVLDDGKIVGKGTHDELMKNCQVYQEIAYSQLSKEELANALEDIWVVDQMSNEKAKDFKGNN